MSKSTIAPYEMRIAIRGQLLGATVTKRITGWISEAPLEKARAFKAKDVGFRREERYAALEQLLDNPTYWLQAKRGGKWQTLTALTPQAQSTSEYLASLPSISSGSDEECPGGCGQSERNCTCAETASWKAHNANPATRGSYWVP